jgi:hypothetical protein
VLLEQVQLDKSLGMNGYNLKFQISIIRCGKNNIYSLTILIALCESELKTTTNPIIKLLYIQYFYFNDKKKKIFLHYGALIIKFWIVQMSFK